jgi:hypothetical protein
MNWQGDLLSGARFNNNFASGFIYSANVGWINLGDAPINEKCHSNTATDDFGINLDATGDPQVFNLTGYAYGANIGWINFDVKAQAGTEYQPRIDMATGILKGYAWSANVGWLSLESPGISQVKIRLDSATRSWELYE